MSKKSKVGVGERRKTYERVTSPPKDWLVRSSRDREADKKWAEVDKGHREKLEEVMREYTAEGSSE